MPRPLLELRHASKIYQLGETQIRALDDVSVKIFTHEFVAVVGPSGSGKSTFLQIASNLAAVSSGEVFFDDKNVSYYNETERALLRNQKIGFVFQQFNLLPRTSAWENVALPLTYAGVTARLRKQRALELLARVGLADRANNQPSQLSGGQQQRVAIARALVNNPALIFADEPTGNLDSKSSQEIKKILTDLHQDNRTIIVVTHDMEVAAIAQRRLTFSDGKIVEDSHA